MKNLAKITIILFLFGLIAVGFSISAKKTEASQCFYPFQRIELEEVYNGSVCQGYFQVYYFPVITDGRKYTITLRRIEGEQKLYASRYKNEVDDLSDLSGWYCDDDHCDSSTQVNVDTKIVTFRSPTGEEGYYSWFAVYGSTAGKYQIGVSNNGLMQFVLSNEPQTPPNPQPPFDPSNSGNDGSEISWRGSATEAGFMPFDFNWTSLDYADGAWQSVKLPDRNWNCDDCFKRFRGTFNLSSVPSDLKASFSSDDGIWLFINGISLGRYGANRGEWLCVNNFACGNNKKVADIPLTNLRAGKNVISAVVYDGGQGEYFDLQIKR